MNLAEVIKNLFFPYTKEIGELRESIHEQAKIAKDTGERVQRMMATLNGEDDWFLQRVKKEGRHD